MAAEHLRRRQFLKTAGLLSLSSWLPCFPWSRTTTAAQLPFANGERPLVRYPGKRHLLRLTTRPLQLETPFSVFDENILTPNDAFFVRYHLAVAAPPTVSPEAFRLNVKGTVKTSLELSLPSLRQDFQPIEFIAVNQCSGNSRGFFEPRVGGGQYAHGAMGNARWEGIRLRDILRKAGLLASARQVTFDGLDHALLPQTPDFVKALDIDHALDGEVMLAYKMNGADLPALNGYPLRLVVPGYFGTYWVKHVHEIVVLDKVYDGYWMSAAYRIPDNDCACVPPSTKPDKTRPIGRLTVRSFMTNLPDGAEVHLGQSFIVRGIAFDGGSGIRSVQFSSDGGKTWRDTELGEDLGRYSFRAWTIPFTPHQPGQFQLQVKATNRAGDTQPPEPTWNPAGYMRNVIESTRITAV